MDGVGKKRGLWTRGFVTRRRVHGVWMGRREAMFRNNVVFEEETEPLSSRSI